MSRLYSRFDMLKPCHVPHCWLGSPSAEPHTSFRNLGPWPALCALQFGHNESLKLTNSTARFLFPTAVIVNGSVCALPHEIPAFTPRAPSSLPISLTYIGLLSAIVFTAVLSYGMLV